MIATMVKNQIGMSERTAAVVVKIMWRESVFLSEVEAAASAAGGASPSVLKIAVEQATAAVGTIYCLVLTLRRQWAENGGREGRLPEKVEFYGDQEFEKGKAILSKLKAAESSLRSIFHVVLDEWKLGLRRPANHLTPEGFSELPIAEAGAGVLTMQLEIGTRVLHYHASAGSCSGADWLKTVIELTVNVKRDPTWQDAWKVELETDAATGNTRLAKDARGPCFGKLFKGDVIKSVNGNDNLDADGVMALIKEEVAVEFTVAAEWFTANHPPEILSSCVDAYYAARNEVVKELVPSILNDVRLYSEEAHSQATSAGPLVMARLARVGSNKHTQDDPDILLTPERIAVITQLPGDAPGSATLARLSYDQHIACSGSIALYKTVSQIVASLKDDLSTPGVVLPGDVKGKERTVYKSALKYLGDTTKCHDKIRCTCQVETLEDMATVAEGLEKSAEFVVVKVKNRFDSGYDSLPIGGYRDMQFSGLFKLARLNIYVWCEVQLNLTRMIALKSGKAEGQDSVAGKAGHDGFNLARAINAFAPESFLHEGEWSSDLAERARAGLLLEINLNSSTPITDAAQWVAFTEALTSKQCRVRKLDMMKMKFNEAASNSVGMMLAKNTALSSINLRRCDLGEVGGSAIGEALKVNTTLTDIILSDNNLALVGAIAIADALKVNSTLTSVAMANNELDDDCGIAIGNALAINDTLATIILRSNNLGEKSGAAIGKALKVNTAMLSITLTENGLGPAGGAAIGDALEVNNSLKFINLEDNSLGDDAGETICRALKANSALTAIHLEDNNLGEKTAIAIADALADNTTLKSVSLYDNELGVKAGLAIAGALRANSTLASLHLYSTNLGEDGGVAIVNALQENSTLVSLNLEDNSLGEVGANAVALMLTINSKLASIHLGDNDLGEVGGSAIGKSLKVNTTLKTIRLNDNNLGENAGAAIIEALKVNTTLTSVDLSDNDDMPQATKDQIEAAVSRNQKQNKVMSR